MQLVLVTEAVSLAGRATHQGTDEGHRDASVRSRSLAEDHDRSLPSVCARTRSRTVDLGT